MTYKLETIKHIVIEAAQEKLLPYFANIERSYKPDGSVITDADHQMQAMMLERLTALHPDTLVLGEEMSTDEQQRILVSDQPVWCLDPLDGTNNYSSGIPYFSVSLALILKGRVVLGIVYDPVRDECFAASEHEDSSLNGKRLQVRQSDLQLHQTIAIIDFKRLPKALATRLVTEMPYASQRSFGSVALDWCWLTAGRCHLYLHGRSNIWDYAAGHYIFTRAGGLSSTMDGESVFTDSLSPRSCVAAVDRPLYDAWSGWLRQTQD